MNVNALRIDIQAVDRRRRTIEAVFADFAKTEPKCPQEHA